MGNNQTSNDGGARIGDQTNVTIEPYSDYEDHIINRGTLDMPRPQLKFHTVCGINIHLLKDCRVARRRDSFCKGLAFSNRPIGIDEIVCIRLCEVGTNWSGVMRFGVTNVDPASFRDIELPKFACPDLTSKGGYWAKSLAERYSTQNALLHFFVNDKGEMYYGVNGVHKGLFLSGIGIHSPLWIILDIYGNSVAVEFVDPSEVRIQRRTPSRARPAPVAATQQSATESNESSPAPMSRDSQQQHSAAMMTASSSANNLLFTANSSSRSASSRASPMTGSSSNSRMRFHSVKGVNVNLQHDDTVAVRKHGEYYLGYVFTERPIRIGERLVILVSMTEDAFSGSLAFGLTSCDPTQVPASRLPSDSDELLERPEYWVCIKDVGAMPQVGDKLTFQVDAAGRVLFSKNDAPSRVIMYVDVSIPLWMFFDLYGSTRKIQILDLDQPSSSLNVADLARSIRASSEGACSQSASPPSLPTQSRYHKPASQWNMESLRVALPALSGESSSSASILQPETVALPVATSTSGSASIPSSSAVSSSSAPSSSAPFSLGIDPNELAKIRAQITLRRLNQQQQQINNSMGNSQADQTTAFPSPPSDSSPPNVSRYLSSLDEFLASRRRLREAQSPASTNRISGGPRSTLADAFEAAYTSNLGATVTVPLLPPPLFSSLDIGHESRGEQQNRRNRTAEYEATNHSSGDDDSPKRADEAKDGGNRDDDRANECSICMSNRVNAVIYRCGHMCMCFPCAKETHRRSGDCPICRTPIIDVIRCYPV